MEMNAVSEMINSIGFPAVMVGALGYYLNKRDKEKLEYDKESRARMNQERDMLIESVEKCRITNEKLLETSRELAESNRMLIGEVSAKINTVENTLIEIKHSITE